MAEKENTRRWFIKVAGTGSLALPAIALGAKSDACPPAPTQNSAQANTPGYRFFTEIEAAFVSAVVDTFIPADELTPSGTALGIVNFIDGQLDGAYGADARRYITGPHLPGIPEQGNQSPLHPAEIYRLAIPAIDQWCETNRKAPFAKLDAAGRDAVLRMLHGNQIALPNAPLKQFFSTIYNDCMEGFFSDPMYGGNRDMASWKMVGFPGPFRNYSAEIEPSRFRKYVAAPLGIRDLVGG